METTSRGTEWKVGLFLFVGLLVTATLAVYFGKLGTGLQKHYEITVEFDNADRLLGGADVYLSGSKVGFVGRAPELIPGKYAVKVGLKVKNDIKLPKKCKIVVSSAGLMGDVFVSINPEKDASPDDAVEPGAYIIGSRQEGLSDLTAKSGDVIEELKNRLVEFKEFKTTIERVNKDLLSEDNVKSLKATFENLKTTTENFKKASADIDGLVAKGKEAMTSAKDAMDTAKGAMGKLDGALAKADSAFGKVDTAVDGMKSTFVSFGKFSDSATKTMESAKVLINKANSGGGALGMLLADKEAALNLKSLIRNLKERGVLFYKDKPKE
jgi:phospholipid/cholesterol/gamma-HCH transport system substrate-binding protein